MALTVTLNLPPELERKLRDESRNLNSDVRDAYALELYRQGRLTLVELSHMLGVDRHETAAFLKRHEVFEGSLTLDDLSIQDQMIERLKSKS